MRIAYLLQLSGEAGGGGEVGDRDTGEVDIMLMFQVLTNKWR